MSTRADFSIRRTARVWAGGGPRTLSLSSVVYICDGGVSAVGTGRAAMGRGSGS